MKLFITTIFILSFLNVFSQKKQNIYFLKNSGKEVKIRDSADYIRMISEPDSGSVFYDLKEYYLNGKPKRMGMVSSFSPYLKLEGTVISYNSNGTKNSIVNFKNNKLIGKSIYYHDNGKLKEIGIYETETDVKDIKNNLKYRIVNIADSSGHRFLDSLGNGFVSLTKENGDKESGTYLNGYKNGVWKEFVAKENMEYQEVYEKGKFVKGEYKTESGEINTYTVKDQLPEFKGGMEGFGSFFSRTFNRPQESRENNEKGRVVLNFMVEADGSLSNIKVVKSVSPLLDAEAIRVLSKSPKWKPAIQRGKAVRLSYTMPITLN